MSIQQITERETALANTLRMTTEALTLVTKERDRLSALADKWNLECDEMREDNKRMAAELKSLRNSGVELPEHDHHISCDNGRIKVYVYFKDTLERYGDRRAAAERERCAKVCAGLWRVDGQFTADEFADEIRKGE